MASYEAELKKLQDRYCDFATRSAQGDKLARESKAAVAEEMRQVERTAAKAGVVLERNLTRTRNGEVVSGDITSTHVDSKRDLQGDYIRRLKERNGGDEQHEPEVEIKTKAKPKGEVTTITKWHKQRFGH